MHATPPPAFRCHRCGKLVRVVSSGCGLPGVYWCGHQDRSADLAVAAGNNYLPGATASPDRFADDLGRGLQLMAGERVLDYDRWLREDAQQGVRALLARMRLPDTEPPPITNTDVS